MKLKLFKLTVLSVEGEYKYERKCYGTSEQSIRKGWEEYGLNKIGRIVEVQNYEERM